MPTVMVVGASRGIGLEFVRQYAAAGWTMMYLANACSPGLQIYATHRVVVGLDADVRAALPERLRSLGFEVEERAGDDAATLAHALDEAGAIPAAAIWRPGDVPLLARLVDDAALGRAFRAAAKRLLRSII